MLPPWELGGKARSGAGRQNSFTGDQASARLSYTKQKDNGCSRPDRPARLTGKKEYVVTPEIMFATSGKPRALFNEYFK